MTSPVVVAIDGPAGSGKSSVSKAVARTLGYEYLDTGAAYRALAWHALDEGIDVEVPEEVLGTLPGLDLAIGTDPDYYFVRVGGEDITPDIREPRVTGVVSAIARIPGVREHLIRWFRETIEAARKPGIVVEGRDITTVVAPHADARILLTASEDVRMARRSAELTTQSAEATAKQLSERDAKDRQVVDFMTAADGVTLIDSTDIDFDATVQVVADFVRSRVQ